MKLFMKIIVIILIFIGIMFGLNYYSKKNVNEKKYSELEKIVMSLESPELKNICTDLYIHKPFVINPKYAGEVIEEDEKIKESSYIEEIKEMKNLSVEKLREKVKQKVKSTVDVYKDKKEILWNKYYVENYIKKYYPEEYVNAELKMSNKDRIKNYLEHEFNRVYSQYYEIVELNMGMYSESVNSNGNEEAVFVYTMIYQNFDRDPDEVGYIKKAKEEKSKFYETYKKEYREVKQGNYIFKAEIMKNGEIKLYTDTNPVGESKWVEVNVDDFVVKP